MFETDKNLMSLNTTKCCSTNGNLNCGGEFTIDNYFIEYLDGVAKVVNNKEKEQETLKMIDNLNSMISTLGLDTKYEEYHCNVNALPNELSCHWDGDLSLEDYTKTFDMSKYGLNGVRAGHIYYNTKPVNVNTFSEYFSHNYMNQSIPMAHCKHIGKLQ